MISNLVAVQQVYDHLSGSSLHNEITGSLYKLRRPLNSKLEDVVINALSITNADIQETFVNVNIHVPNLSVNIEGNVDRSVPDLNRIEALTAIGISLLEETWFDGGFFEIQQQNIIQDEEGDNHFANLRLLYRIVNA